MIEAVFRRVLEEVLARVTEFSVATGDATGGSTTTLEDTSAVWETNKWKDAVVEITDVSTGKHYYVTITENDADTLTFPAIAVAVVAGDHYEIRMTLRLADIEKWAGTTLTPRDITTDIQKLTTGIEVADRAARLLGVIYGSQAQQILQRATTYDLLIQLRHAGAEIDPRAIRALTSSDVVDLSDKWARQLGLVDISRVLGAALSATNPVIVRLTDGTAVITSPIKTQLPAALTTAGNLKLSIEERLAAAVVLHASGAETTSGNGADTDVSKYLYAESCIDVTAFADMASADLIVEGKDETSGKYKTIHTHNFTGTGTDWLSITMLAFQHVRARWVINTPGGSPSVTFSVGLQGKS